MRSPTKYLLAAALLVGAAAGADERPSTDVTIDEAHQDAISRRAAKFKGSIFLFDQSITPDTLNAGAQQSAIPSYQWWMSLRPRYYIKPNLSLRLRMDLTIEWTNGGADTTLLREAQFGTIWTDLAYNAPEFAGIKPTIAFRAIWGTSKEALFQGDVADMGPSVGLVREFHTKKGGDLELSLSMYALYHFVTHSTPGLAPGQNGFFCQSLEGRATVCESTDNPQNTQVNLTTFVAGKWAPIPQLSISLSYAVLDSWAYETPDIVLNGKPVARAADDTRFRQSGWFLASIDYDPRDWISLSLGYYCVRPILDPDGTYGDPFFKPGGNSRIFLTTTFNLDRVYDAAARRAQRNKVNAILEQGGTNLAKR